MGDVVLKREEDIEEEEQKEKGEFDDLAEYFKHKKEKNKEMHLSFILNLLDGLIETPGRIIIMTTNHIDTIDPALIRPGRMDLLVKFAHLTDSILQQMLSSFFPKIENKKIDKACRKLSGGAPVSSARAIQLLRSKKTNFDKAIDILYLEKFPENEIIKK
eukprot:Trichotokara_eunicae@DN5498_c0_g1_i4.p1